MRNLLPANVSLAIVIVAAMTAVALRAATRRTAARGIPGAEAVPVAAIADCRPDGSGEQIQSVFHELHADGHHALCGVCNNV